MQVADLCMLQTQQAEQDMDCNGIWCLSVVTPHTFYSRPVFIKGTSLMSKIELPAISVAP